jgi:photosystem II stability/assembly factor-like uncharacterized protein
MKKIIYTFYILLLAGTTGRAQIKIPAALESRLTGKNKLYEIMQIVDSFYQTRADTDNQSMREWKHWNRWAWEMGRYVNPDGKLVNTRKVYSDALLEKQQQPLADLNESTGAWSFIGPDAFTYVNGGSQGLGRVDAIAFHPTNSNIMYVGTPNGGVFKTTNGGATWSNLPNYGPYLGASDIVVDHTNPSIVYVLTGDGDGGGFVTRFGYRSYSNGVMKSFDSGNTWQLLNNGFPTGDTIWSGFTLAQNPQDADVLLAATRRGLYRTANGGNTWTKVLDSFCTDVKFRPGSSNCYAAGNGWCNFSTNGGLTWTASQFSPTQLPDGANRSQLAVSPANPDYVYMLCGPAFAASPNYFFKGIWLSTNGGQSFSLRANTPNILGSSIFGNDGNDQSGYDLALAVSSTNATIIFTGGIIIWKSTNAGANLSSSTINDLIPNQLHKFVHSDVHDLQVNPLTGHLWAATDGGVYRTTDGGNNWTDFSIGISSAQPYHLAGFEALPNLLMIGSQDNGTKNRIFNTNTWRQIAGADGFDVVFDFNNSSRAWFIANESTYFTPDYGDTAWTIDNNCGNCNNFYFPNIAQHVTNPNILFIGSKDVYRTTDNGTTYSTFTVPTGYWDIVTCPSNSNRIYCAGGDELTHTSSDGKMFRSDDGGDNWTEISTGTNFPPTAERTKITSIGVNPSNSNFVWATFGGTIASTKVFFSGNGGGSWSNISSGLPNVPVNCITVTANNDVYVGTELGVYYRPTGGVWTPFYNNLPNSPVTELVINQTAGKIRAATFGRGVWESPLFTNCIPVVSVTGTQNGRKLYEASTQVNSTAIVTGGAGTEIFFKGGNNVTLTPGFEARTGSEFKAYINGCGLGGIPDMNGRLTSGIDYTTHRLPVGDSAKYPYGTIELNPAGSEATYRIYKPGAYTLQITDSKGYIIQTLTEKQLPTGTHHFSFTKPAATEMLYLQLWYNKELVHYQEINYTQ